MLNSNLLDELKEAQIFKKNLLHAQLHYNEPESANAYKDSDYNTLFEYMVGSGSLKIAVIIAGQGPEAFGMPEMFTPMQQYKCK
nr:hypothetical protein [Sinobaca sp. H24]